MTSTNLQRKRSEHGASLILLVSIIGLAFIVTVAAMLVAASNGQDTARLASAKVDVANREDVLMREILRETATGILNTAPETWTTIMTNATTNNRLVTNYVDKQELTDLGITGVTTMTTANAGDTGGNPLDIFQGYPGASGEYNREVPFGGTSGVSNDAFLDPNYTLTQRAVAPPHMNWPGNTSANATTTPQEFFLGSLYTAGTPPTQSSGHRWAQLTYPAIRFGYKQPGDRFVARRVWWRIPLVYNTTQQTVEDQKVPPVYRYPSAPANYVLSAYEIPSQLPISGNANLQIGAWGSGSTVTVTGSIYGDQIQLYGGTYNSVSSRQGVTVKNPTTVGTDNTGNPVTYSDSTFDQPGMREQMALKQTYGVAAPVSVAGNDGKVLIVPVLPLGSDGRPSATEFYNAAPSTPTHWDLYARPYYRCRIRIIINGTNPNLTVNVYSSPDTLTQPDQILGFQDGTPIAQYTQSTLPSSGYMNYTSDNILAIDVYKMVAFLGGATTNDTPVKLKQKLALIAPELYSIYIGWNPTDALSVKGGPGIAITDTHDLSLFINGLSIVSNQILYLLDAFNQVIPTGAPSGSTPPPTSIYAPKVQYSTSAISPQVTLTGQVAVVATSAPSPVNPLSFTVIPSSDTNTVATFTTATLTEVTDPTPYSKTFKTGLPPITALNLLFTVEKEQN